jgi:hypothetical protein
MCAFDNTYDPYCSNMISDCDRLWWGNLLVALDRPAKAYPPGEAGLFDRRFYERYTGHGETLK